MFCDSRATSVTRNIENHRRSHFSLPTNLFFFTALILFCSSPPFLLLAACACFWTSCKLWVRDIFFIRFIISKIDILYVRRYFFPFAITSLSIQWLVDLMNSFAEYWCNSILAINSIETKPKKKMCPNVLIVLISIKQVSCAGGTSDTARIRTHSVAHYQFRHNLKRVSEISHKLRMKTIPIEFTSKSIYCMDRRHSEYWRHQSFPIPREKDFLKKKKRKVQSVQCSRRLVAKRLKHVKIYFIFLFARTQYLQNYISLLYSIWFNQLHNQK